MERSCPQRKTCPKAQASARRAFERTHGAVAQTIALSASDVLGYLPSLDHVVSVTRNTAAAMTTVGRYAVPQPLGAPLRVEAGRIGLRVHLPSLGAALAAEHIPACRKPQSLHVFDRDGLVAHETYLTSLAENTLLERLASDAASAPGLDPRLSANETAAAETWSWQPRPLSPAAGPHADAGGHLDSILRDNGITRRASLPAWGEHTAWQIDTNDLPRLCTLLGEAWMPLGIAVGNVGVVQYHHGAIDGVKRYGTLMQLSATCTNVTLSLGDIEEAWVSRIEIGDRHEHILELYDWRYHCIAQFKDADDSDDNLRTFWSQILSTLPRPNARCCRRT